MNRRYFASRLAMIGLTALASLSQLVPAAAADFAQRELSPQEPLGVSVQDQVIRRDDDVPQSDSTPEAQGGSPVPGIADKPKPLVKIGSFPMNPSRFAGKSGGNYRKRGIGSAAVRRSIVAGKKRRR